MVGAPDAAGGALGEAFATVSDTDTRDEPREGLRRRVIAGFAWTGGSAATLAALQLLRIIVLARLLDPADFGLMAMVMVIVMVTDVIANLGLGEAIIYRQQISREQLSSLYWLNVLSGLVAFVLIWASTPLIVGLYDEPRLTGVLFWVALTFFLGSLGKQFEVLLRKELRFKTLSLIEMTSAAVTFSVSIGVALVEASVYALVWGLVAGVSMKVAVLVAIGLREHPPQWRFRPGEIRDLVGFGLYRTGEMVANQMTLRVGQLVMGIVLGAQALGFYQVAYNIAFQPMSQINPILTKVTFPVFARIQDDRERLKSAFFLQMRALAAITVPLLFGIMAVAPVFVPTVLGEAWRDATPVLQALAAVGLLRSLNNPMGSILMVSGRVRENFWWNLALLVLLVPAVLIGASLADTVGVALAWLVLQAVFMVIGYQRLTKPVLGPCLGDYITSVGPAAAAGLAMTAVVLTAAELMGQHSGWPALVALVALGAAVYGALMAAYYRSEAGRLLSFGRQQVRQILLAQG